MNLSDTPMHGSTVLKQRVVSVEHLPPDTTLEHVGEPPPPPPDNHLCGCYY